MSPLWQIYYSWQALTLDSSKNGGKLMNLNFYRSFWAPKHLLTWKDTLKFALVLTRWKIYIYILKIYCDRKSLYIDQDRFVNLLLSM